MIQINYKKVKCPKCGKSYFRVKENSGVEFTNLLFNIKPDPIYKNGELQNPTEAEPIKVRCKCVECGCDFRVETHDVFGDYRFINEDEELEEVKRKLSESCRLKIVNENLETLKEETEKAKAELIVGTPCQMGEAIKVSKMPVVTETYHETMKKEIEEIKERLAKLESE